jgi:uncharacterized protein (DUF58 family)
VPLAAGRRGRLPGPGGPALAKRLEALHLTVSGAGLVALSAAGWALANRIGSRAGYLLVYSGLAAMIVSYLASRRRPHLEVERSHISLRTREGQVNPVTITVTSRRRVSALILQEQLHPALGTDVEVPVATLAPGEEVEHRYSFSPTRRGVYPVGPLVAVTTDPFGLTTSQQHLLDAVEVIVHPSTQGVDDRILARMWEDPPMRPPVSKPWPTGFEFYGMRDYVPGDDPRRVVWTAVAKTGRMMVRESEQGITDRVSIILDNSREHHSPGDPSQTFELGIRVAASVAKKHVDDGFSVSLTANGRRLATALRGGRAATLLLDHLARLDLAPSAMKEAGPILMDDARSGAHFVVITPHIDKDTTALLRLVMERGASVTIGSLLWDETDPLSLARAASLGCRAVQIPVGVSITGAFAHQVGGGFR